MISRQRLQQAAEQNLIDARQVDPLFNFLQQRTQPASDNLEEPLRFIRSFGDVFITLGIVLLVLAINMAGLSGYLYLAPIVGFIALSEWLVRVRKLVLPGIAILLAILFFINKAITFDHLQANSLELALLSLTSLLFYLRYKMPFSMLPLAAGLVAIVVIQTGVDILHKPIIFVALGVIVFMVAMAFDMLDTRRESQLSDSAFWLHLLASPLMVHGAMFSMLTSDQQWIRGIDFEIVIVGFFSVFFLLALLLDRRAMLISTQVYVIYASTQLLQTQVSNTQNVIMYVMLGLGLFVLFFGTYWYKTRKFLFGFLAGSRLSQYLPDLNLSDVKR